MKKTANLEYGHLVVLGYSSYRIEENLNKKENNILNKDNNIIINNNHQKNQNEHKINKKSWQPVGDQNIKFYLKKRKISNGLTLVNKNYNVLSRKNNHLILNNTSIPIKLEYINNKSKSLSHLILIRNHKKSIAAIGYTYSNNEDIYQIGRMPVKENDFVVPGPLYGISGTISRYAARISCSRSPPYECRLYAAGFDSNNTIQLSDSIPKFCFSCNQWYRHVPETHSCYDVDYHDSNDSNNALNNINLNNSLYEFKKNDFETLLIENNKNKNNIGWDILTKNGVRLYLPEKKEWYEVSINGFMYPINNSNSNNNHLIRSTFNRPTTKPLDNILPILQDGSIIDLGGVQLQFQRPNNNNNFKNNIKNIHSILSKLDTLNIQCPVHMHPLQFTYVNEIQNKNKNIKRMIISKSSQPHVYPGCGHVFGFDLRMKNLQICPLCRTESYFVPLLVKETFQLKNLNQSNHSDINIVLPDCVFNPCGHAISMNFAKHYSSLYMPNGRSICPFCAITLNIKKPFSKLYVYTEEGDIDLSHINMNTKESSTIQTSNQYTTKDTIIY